MDVGGSKGGLKADINVTPLVDVMLVLLIIMMLVAPMLQKGVDVKLPQAANTTDKPETQGQTVVGIQANKAVFLNSVPVRSRRPRQPRRRSHGDRRPRKWSSSRPTKTSITARSWRRWITCARQASKTWASSPTRKRGRWEEATDDY